MKRLWAKPWSEPGVMIFFCLDRSNAETLFGGSSHRIFPGRTNRLDEPVGFRSALDTRGMGLEDWGASSVFDRPASHSPEFPRDRLPNEPGRPSTSHSAARGRDRRRARRGRTGSGVGHLGILGGRGRACQRLPLRRQMPRSVVLLRARTLDESTPRSDPGRRPDSPRGPVLIGRRRLRPLHGGRSLCRSDHADRIGSDRRNRQGRRDGGPRSIRSSSDRS